MQQAMRKIENGKYPKNKSQKIAAIVQEYVTMEKQYQVDLKLLKNELRNLTR
jgi:hypothetical protein